MDLLSIIALGVAAYAIFSGKKSLSEYSDHLDGLDANVELALSQAANAATLVQGEASDLAISVCLSISSIGDTLWNGSVMWTVKNNGSQNYYIHDIKSKLVLCGYPIDQWVPGNRDMVYIKAGETVNIYSSINDKRFWQNAQVCKIVRDKIKERLGVNVLSSVKFPVPAEGISDLLTVDGTSFSFSSAYSANTRDVNLTNELPSALLYPAYVKVYERKGSNSLDW